MDDRAGDDEAVARIMKLMIIINKAGDKKKDKERMEKRTRRREMESISMANPHLIRNRYSAAV